MNTATNVTAPSKPRKKRKAKKGKPLAPLKPSPLDNLQDTFKKDVVDQEHRHLTEEHRVKIRASDKLHEAKLRSIMDQLQLQLYKIWNDMWLQRKKTLDAAFKEWLKVFAS